MPPRPNASQRNIPALDALIVIGRRAETGVECRNGVADSEENAMKVFLAACLALSLIAICAAVVLNAVNQPVDEAFASASSVRI
jgi:hypothetical protein